MIKESAAALAKRADAAIISTPNLAVSLVDEYNQQLQEAKDLLPNELSIQVLKKLEYPSHRGGTGKWVATAARKLARAADGLMAGDIEAVQKTQEENPIKMAREEHEQQPQIPPAIPPQSRSAG